MRYIVILIIGLIAFTSCNNQSENPEKMNIQELQTLAVEIQKDFAHLNMQMADITEEKLYKMNDDIAKLSDNIKKIREELPKETVNKDILVLSVKLYYEMLDIYNEAGFNTEKIKDKIDAMKKGIKNL